MCSDLVHFEKKQYNKYQSSEYINIVIKEARLMKLETQIFLKNILQHVKS